MFNIWDWLRSKITSVFNNRIFVTIVAFFVLFCVLVARLFNLQIVNGQQYLDDYKLQIQKTRVIQGTRGNIYDRNGNLLAYNKLAYSVMIEDNGSYSSISEKNDALNQEIAQIIGIVESNGDSIINDFKIIVENDQYVFTMDDKTQKLRFIADIYGLKTIDELTDEQREQSAEDIMHYLCTDELYGYGIPEETLDKNSILKLVTVRYAISLKSFQKYLATTIAEDVSDETVAAIMEQADQLQGVSISEDSIREYTSSKYFANIIGYTGQISQDEYDALSEEDQERYSLTDTIGKAGLEQIMDSELQGVKGEEKLYVNSVGKVIESTSLKESQAGNDLYLTLDLDLQMAAYDLLEAEIAGVLLAKMADTLDYDRSTCTDAGDVIVASGDMYYSFIGNSIVDINHFSEEDAGTAEKEVYDTFSKYKESVINSLIDVMQDTSSANYCDLEREQQAYQSYVINDILTTNGVIDTDAIDKNDSVYQQWKNDETINIATYINYAISQNWINVSKLQSYMNSESNYSDANQIFTGILEYTKNKMENDNSFDRLIYRYMIKAGTVTGRQISMILYEQKVLPYDETSYNSLMAGSIGAYDFIRSKIQTLEITPGQLGLEPCTGSVVITDPNSGEVLACVSYPGYDNNKLANSMDSEYYSKLVFDSSKPLFNNATQERTAPGSTYKPLAAIAGLTEGVITADYYYECDGVYDNVEPNVKCWVYPSAHGGLEITGAIANSCNEYFCNLGLALGMKETGVVETNEDGQEVKERTYSSEYGLERLAKYAEMFGLNEKSGLEISESEPQVSDEDSVRSAMGQGTNNYTTSQLARYVTALANEGTVYNLSLIDRIQTPEGKVKEDFTPEVRNTIDDLSKDTWNLVHTGMRGVVTNSSVFDKMNSTQYEVYGKTGTAQQSTTHPDHGLFIGFAPSDTGADISLAIRIANGYSSTFAAEVGAKVFEYYYGVTPESELITGNAATVTITSHGD